MSELTKKPKYGYDNNPDENRPYRRLAHVPEGYDPNPSSLVKSQIPTYEYLDVDEDGNPIGYRPQSAKSSNIPSAAYDLQYDATRGILHLSPYQKVLIAKRGSAKQKDGSESLECRILRVVFKTVNTQKTGVNFSKILTLSEAKIGHTEKVKIRNAVNAINVKVVEAKGPKKLMTMQGKKVFVNNSYL